MIVIAFGAGCVTVGLLRYSKDDEKPDDGKSPLQRLREADDDIDVRQLTKKELDTYYAICNNGELDALFEMHERGIR